MSIVIFTKYFLMLEVKNMETVVTLGLSDNFNLGGMCMVRNYILTCVTSQRIGIHFN